MTSYPKLEQFDLVAGAPLALVSTFGGDSPADHEAETQTYANGVAAGRAQAAAESKENAILDSALATSLKAALGAATTEIEASHARVLNTILRAVLPWLARHTAAQEIRSFIGKLSATTLQGQVILSVPPKLTPRLQDIISSLEDGGADFKIAMDQDMTGANVRANWVGGNAEIDIDKAVAACLAILEQHELGDTHASP